MKNELLKKLEELLEAENPLEVQKEFNAAKTKLKGLMEPSEASAKNDRPESKQQAEKASGSDASDKIAAENPAADTSANAEQGTPEKEIKPIEAKAGEAPSEFEGDSDENIAAAPEAPKPDEAVGQSRVLPNLNSADEQQETKSPAEENLAQTAPADETREPEASPESQTTDVAQADEKETAQATPDSDAAPPKAADETPGAEIDADGEDAIGSDAIADKFAQITGAFKAKLNAARAELKRIEEETVATANDLMAELRTIVENEENIGKAFSGFNAIQDKWKSLPKVSNDNYRDLNVEYNKLIERFFYNINIYKELKELDLKKNLEEKLKVLEAQKELAASNDIRLLEVEVRMNQDRWNEIGPTFKEEWDKIKDEFWEVTRGIYKRIQDFYNERKEEQERNLEAKKVLLDKVKQIEALELKAHKKWQEKTKEIIALQNEWKLVGYVPKDKGKKVWKEFREVCDAFFDKKRAHYAEIRAEQDANKAVKEELLKEAEAIKDSDDWKETADRLIFLQKKWKETGAAHQRDENKLWRQFRAACDHFFQARNEQRTENKEEEKENLKRKEEVIEALKAFEPDPADKTAVEKLKSFSEDWRKIGHVPFKVKDKVNKAYKDLMDEKFAVLKIDRREKEKIRFEEKVDLLKSSDAKEKLVRKEQDIIRSKISKIESEINQYENNLGFFANSKGAEKLKEQVVKKIDKAKQDVDALYAQLDVLDEVNE